MTLTVTADRITSTTTGHAARQTCNLLLWEVSWLPDRVVKLDQAVTALVLAEHVTRGAVAPDHKGWPLVGTLAAELDLTPADAVQLIRGTS